MNHERVMARQHGLAADAADALLKLGFRQGRRRHEVKVRLEIGEQGFDAAGAGAACGRGH
jgi:hypothetical protein